MFEDVYKTIKEISKGQFRDKGSRFIAIAVPVSNEDDIKNQLQLIKKEYFDATHHCYAWRLGWDKSAYRVNDDGEPSGTAGKPIFGQIQSFDLTNILIVVVRYYGGTKLGVSGLIQAYKTSTQEALSNAIIIEKTVNEEYNLSFAIEEMNHVMKVLKDYKANIISMDYSEKQELKFSIRRMFADEVVAKLTNTRKIDCSFVRLI